jgi:hypothetical protein
MPLFQNCRNTTHHRIARYTTLLDLQVHHSSRIAEIPSFSKIAEIPPLTELQIYEPSTLYAVWRIKSDRDWNLSCLHVIVSGGEANVVKTCDAVSQLISQYNAPKNGTIPGFGMIETCAGCIYSLSCPKYDLDHPSRNLLKYPPHRITNILPVTLLDLQIYYFSRISDIPPFYEFTRKPDFITAENILLLIHVCINSLRVNVPHKNHRRASFDKWIVFFTTLQATHRGNLCKRRFFFRWTERGGSKL